MAHPAVYVVTGVVVAFAALLAIFTSTPAKPMSYGSRSSNRDRQRRKRTPPPSPTPSKRCTSCGKAPFVKVHPCNHESMCKGCMTNYLETQNTCPSCNGEINSCSPPILPFEKCNRCHKFTKLFKFLPCEHSPSLCFCCFENQKISYKVCPTCRKVIQGCDPQCNTSGVCSVCHKFTQIAMFKPGHGSYCKEHAAQYLETSNKCNISD